MPGADIYHGSLHCSLHTLNTNGFLNLWAKINCWKVWLKSRRAGVLGGIYTHWMENQATSVLNLAFNTYLHVNSLTGRNSDYLYIFYIALFHYLPTPTRAFHEISKINSEKRKLMVILIILFFSNLKYTLGCSYLTSPMYILRKFIEMRGGRLLLGSFNKGNDIFRSFIRTR